MKVVQVIDALDASGAAKQLRLVAPELVRADIAMRVVCLGEAAAWQDDMRRAGVAIDVLNWTRWFDPGALWQLRGILRQAEPDLVHVWRRAPLRAVALVARELLPRVVASAPLPTKGALPWWDRLLLQHARGIAVNGPGEQQRCASLGIDAPKLHVVPSATDFAEPAMDREERTKRRIVCVAKLERESGVRDAIWTLDILNYLFPDMELIIAGDGPHRAELEAFTACTEQTNVRFLGEIDRPSELLRDADVCWVTSHDNRGRQTALDAMAAGCPVVGYDVPCLRDLIVNGETGFLVSIGDRVGLARRTRTLFEDANLGERITQAARAAVSQRFTPRFAAQQWHALYRRLAG
jgi:glycosyltransferase involved in cell wall biosynthesis